jgi:Cu/Ag efflux pump CusA
MVQRAVKLYSERTSHDLAQITQRLPNNKKQDLTPISTPVPSPLKWKLSNDIEPAGSKGLRWNTSQ